VKDFSQISFSPQECVREINEFEQLLKSKKELSEKDDVLPFLEKHKQLSLFTFSYVPDIANPDRIAFEYDLYGDFACDLVVGDSTSHTTKIQKSSVNGRNPLPTGKSTGTLSAICLRRSLRL